ncbi:MAG: ABC transporter permease [Planctomycetota bacterium]|jgi:putative ABC transport system permease protein|nr:ABC transporter permease [Planctomycetota bacterium]MDA1200155.1 ABC transporter permease [Planctomycetota bacterium]
MSLLGIAWRNIRQRLLTSGLTALSLALGVALVVATLVIGGLVRDAFASGRGLGYNLIVGAKGSPLQLVLNSVYLVSKPIENISWGFYQEFLPAEARSDGMAGRYAGSVAKAVPICMGDYFRSFRVVGTNAAYFDSLTMGDGRPFAFAAGRNFRDDEFFGGVLGSSVAARLGLAVGDTFSPTHGADDGLVHDPFTVIGVLARTDTPVDRGVYVNMEGFYLQEGHAKPLPDDERDGIDEANDDEAGAEAGGALEISRPTADRPPRLVREISSATRAFAPAVPPDANPPRPRPLPFAQREVTAILIETASPGGMPPELLAMGLKTTINEGRDGQAAEPVREIRTLLDLFVRPLELLLLLVTTLVVIVSAIGILVSMVGSSLERSRDVAVMRALGARRSHVLTTVLLEAILLAVGGGLLGWLLGHAVVAAIGPLITTNAGVSAGFFSSAPAGEALLVPFLIVLAILAALLPALAAYRTDVAKWL